MQSTKIGLIFKLINLPKTTVYKLVNKLILQQQKKGN